MHALIKGSNKFIYHKSDGIGYTNELRWLTIIYKEKLEIKNFSLHPQFATFEANETDFHRPSNLALYPN